MGQGRLGRYSRESRNRAENWEEWVTGGGRMTFEVVYRWDSADTLSLNGSGPVLFFPQPPPPQKTAGLFFQIIRLEPWSPLTPVSHSPVTSSTSNFLAFRTDLEPDDPSPPLTLTHYPFAVPTPPTTSLPTPPTRMPASAPADEARQSSQDSRSCYTELSSCQFSAQNLLMASHLPAKGRVLKMTNDHS